MMPIKTILLVLLLSQTFLISCYSGDSSFNEGATASEADFKADFEQAPMPRTAEPTAPPNDAVEQKPVLLRTADCRLEVEGVQERVRQIEALLEQKGGYLANLEWRNYSYQEEASLTLRVPAEHFTWLVDTVANLAKTVDHRKVKTQDVTEEYVDIESRLKTKKAVRDRYEEILRTRAKSVEDILKTEEQLRRLQEEIEAQEGRLRYLSQRASFSTITLQLYEVLEETAESSWWKDFGGDIGQSLSFSVDLLRSLFLGLLSIWPIVLLIAWLFWRRKKIWKRLRGTPSE